MGKRKRVERPNLAEVNIKGNISENYIPFGDKLAEFEKNSPDLYKTLMDYEIERASRSEGKDIFEDVAKEYNISYAEAKEKVQYDESLRKSWFEKNKSNYVVYLALAQSDEVLLEERINMGRYAIDELLSTLNSPSKVYSSENDWYIARIIHFIGRDERFPGPVRGYAFKRALEEKAINEKAIDDAKKLGLEEYLK